MHMVIDYVSDIIFYDSWLKNSDAVCFSKWNSPIKVEKMYLSVSIFTFSGGKNPDGIRIPTEWMHVENIAFSYCE